MESILTSIKSLLGITAEYKHFDNQVMVYINDAFMTLNHLGVGPDKPVRIESEMETWGGIFGEETNVEMIKTYVGLKVRTLFDPPTTSFVLDAMNRQITELEWRLNSMADVEAKASSEE